MVSASAPVPARSQSTGGHHITDLADLVERMRGAGLAIRLDAPGPVGEDIGVTVYRIVQEALTNVLRHAPTAAVVVTVRAIADGVHVDVRDNGPGPGDTARHGFGLAGLFRAGLAAVLEAASVQVVGDAADGPSAVRAVAALRPDVVLMDIEMPGGDGLTATRQILDPGCPMRRSLRNCFSRSRPSRPT